MTPLNEKDRADLVAYLDGELPEAESRALEVRLNLDPQVRSEAEALRKTWELLDYLPRAEPSPSFTHRTMERISAHVPAVRTSAGRWRWPGWAIGMGWAAAVLLAAGGGYAGVRYLTRPPAELDAPHTVPADPLASMRSQEIEDLLVRDLGLLENRRLYRHIDDLDFLRGLDDADLFGEPDATP
jgi:hypothetical protein